MRAVEFVHDEQGLTYFIEVGDPIGARTPMCNTSRTTTPGVTARTCMNCADARRRLNDDGSYRPTRRS